MKLQALFFALAVLLLTSGEARAQLSCSFAIADMPFGDVPVLTGDPDTATATLTISCGGTGLLSNLDVCVHLGTGGGGQTAGVRHMTTTGGQLDFAFFKDSARLVPWGTGLSTPTFGTQVDQTYTILVNILGIGDLQETMTIYGEVGGNQQTAPIGAYASLFSGGQATVQYRIRSTLEIAGCDLSGTQTATPVFNVSASVASLCMISTEPTGIDFGQHGVLGANVTGAGAVGVTCTNGTPYEVGLDGGIAGAAAPAYREMRLTGNPPGGPLIAYQLYKDAAFANEFGNADPYRLHLVATGAEQTIDVYGRVAPAQNTPAAGTYHDTVVVTVTY
ncbi:MAG: spore coat protein U domain-containing protein [Bauldia sp.]|nr:spore coat protein U domain-containing protein [Bauldia sp.]MCW5718348.1 spore coat protein U domain-containing protein [Bauldia sp.]